jgi:uncharacterized protein (DUF58 family)
MWFNQASSITQQPNVENLLAQLKSNGVTLSIKELIQYQQKASLIDLAASKNLQGHLAGNYLARTKGRGMEFDEVRHYQIGDDIRAIDWRVTARTGKTHTKLFREEVERPVLIATDLTGSMQFGSKLLLKSVQAAHIAALLAWHAKKRGDRVGGIVFNQTMHNELKPRSRKAGVLHYLHALIELQQQAIDLPIQVNKQIFSQNCARLRHLARPGSLVYLLTDARQLSEEAIRHLSQISRHCELVVALISDPLELELPIPAHKTKVLITDGQQQQTLVLGDQKTANEYQQTALNLVDSLNQQLTKTGARVLHYSASQPIEIQLKQGANTWIR